MHSLQSDPLHPSLQLHECIKQEIVVVEVVYSQGSLSQQREIAFMSLCNLHALIWFITVATNIIATSRAYCFKGINMRNII